MHYLLPNKNFIFWLILILHLQAPVYAQEPAFVQLNREPEFRITSGEEQHISLSFLIKAGYHIQADQVKDENLIPTVLSIDTSDALALGDPIFPEAVAFRMQGVQEALDVYSDVLEIEVPVKTATSVKKGLYPIKGTLHYQACDASKCYFPRDLSFVMKINVH